MSHMCYILQNGFNALNYAVSCGHLEVSVMLINNGCNLDAVNAVSYI